MKSFYFTDDSWWDSPGCSCCEASLMETYNSEDTDPSLGSAHHRLDCYIQAIITVLIKRGGYYVDSCALYLLTDDEVYSLCKVMGIEVEIHG